VRRAAFSVVLLLIALCASWLRVAANQSIGSVTGLPLLYTSTPRYEAEAWLKGGERFPSGAQVLLLEGGKSRPLVSGFAATADANVSFDGARVLFAGRKTAQEPWQVWEVTVSGGKVKKVTSCGADCVRPFYLPGGWVVYAEKVQGRFVLQSAALDGGSPLRLSYAPGNSMPTDVLRDGRILFEAAYPMGGATSPEIYTVYSDGSGVESYRCDHGPRRQAGKQAASGDIVFASEHGLGRFTSALARDVDVKAPHGEFAGDAVQVAAEVYVVAWRPDGKARWSLVRWNGATGVVTQLDVADDNTGPSIPPAKAGSARDDESIFMANAVQPALLTARAVPNQHPSGLHEWKYANLLCLNAYTSKLKIAAGSVASVKLYTTDEPGKAKLLGSSPVETDGSFYVQVPGDQPLQIELLDAKGKTLQREQGWWWMRAGEQRICVGCHAGPERAPENAVPQVLVKSTKPVVVK
jgi:hypothetical protein